MVFSPVIFCGIIRLILVFVIILVVVELFILVVCEVLGTLVFMDVIGIVLLFRRRACLLL
jgi:hypothetical protein